MKNKLWLNPVWLTIVAILGISYLQIEYAQKCWVAGNRLLALYTAPVAIVIFALLCIVLVSIQKRGALQGKDETFMIPGMLAMLSGAMIGFQSILQMIGYFKDGVMPTPYRHETNSLDTTFFKIMIFSGVLAGIALLIIGIMWIMGKSTRKTLVLWFTVFPVVWAFSRLARFTISYVSTIRIPITFTSACVLICNAMFFFILGRQMVHHSNGGSWLLAIVAFITATVDISTIAAQTMLPYIHKEYLASAILTVDMNDGIIGLFALVVGTSIFSKKSLSWAEKRLEENTNEIPSDEKMESPFKLGDEVDIVNKMIEEDTEGALLPKRPFNEAFTDEEIQQQKEQTKQEITQ